MYLRVLVPTEVPEGFADTGKEITEFYIQSENMLFGYSVKRIIERYCLDMECMLGDILRIEHVQKCPMGIYSHVMDLVGRYIPPEQR